VGKEGKVGEPVLGIVKGNRVVELRWWWDRKRLYEQHVWLLQFRLEGLHRD
jgi:hypothetical protein